MSDSVWDFLAAIVLFVVGIVFAFPLALLLTVSWNASVVPTFGWPSLDYWPAFWLCITRHILFPSRAIRVADTR